MHCGTWMDTCWYKLITYSSSGHCTSSSRQVLLDPSVCLDTNKNKTTIHLPILRTFSYHFTYSMLRTTIVSKTYKTTFSTYIYPDATDRFVSVRQCIYKALFHYGLGRKVWHMTLYYFVQVMFNAGFIALSDTKLLLYSSTVLHIAVLLV